MIQGRLDLSAEGRQRRCRRNLRWQAVPHMNASNRKCSAANSGAVNLRLVDEACDWWNSSVLRCCLKVETEGERRSDCEAVPSYG